jgi:hypothetical protein
MPEFHHHVDGLECDKALCQICARDLPSCTADFKWLPIPGRSFAGNVCKDCRTNAKANTLIDETIREGSLPKLIRAFSGEVD